MLTVLASGVAAAVVLTGFATTLTLLDAAAGAEDDATGLAAEDAAVDTAGAEDDVADVVFGAGAALVTVDATVDLGDDAAEAAEVVAGGVVLAAGADVPDAGAVVLATAVAAGATAAEVVATAAPETEDRTPPADAAEIGPTAAAMLSTRSNAQILRRRRRIALPNRAVVKADRHRRRSTFARARGRCSTWAFVARIPSPYLSRFNAPEAP